MLDPACGTGGFLVEAFKHLEKQCKTVEDRQILQPRALFGGEAKPLPYLLCPDEPAAARPRIPAHRSLATAFASRSREIGDKDRVDVILTNPPFGGEEERGILGNFPEDKQTSETALLFLQLIMRKLRTPVGSKAAAARQSSCRTARSSATASAPASRRSCSRSSTSTPSCGCRTASSRPTRSIPTNLLFFDRSGPTKDSLVLRAAAARRPEELHQDPAHPVRGIRRLPRMVEDRRRERPRLESS